MKRKILIGDGPFRHSFEKLHKRKQFQLHFHGSGPKKRKYALKFVSRLPKFIDSLIYLQTFKRAIIVIKLILFELICWLVPFWGMLVSRTLNL